MLVSYVNAPEPGDPVYSPGGNPSLADTIVGALGLIATPAIGTVCTFALKGIGSGLSKGAGAVGRGIQKAAKSVRRSKSPTPKALPKLRQAYVDEVAGLANRAKELRNAGHSTEQIARTLHAKRNALKLKYRKLSPADKIRQFEQRNLKKYGDPLGPSITQLRVAGKSWDDIIKSATRPGGSDLGF